MAKEMFKNEKQDGGKGEPVKKSATRFSGMSGEKMDHEVMNDKMAKKLEC